MGTLTNTTPDAPLGTFEEQVMLAVVRTGRAPDGGGAYGMSVRRELEAVTGREHWCGVRHVGPAGGQGTGRVGPQ